MSNSIDDLSSSLDFSPSFDLTSFETISTNDIINFAFIYDDKKHTLTELENKIIEQLQNTNDFNKVITFYTHHLDLFVKNQNKFQNVIKLKIFLDDYLKYRTTFADIKSFIETLSLYLNLTSPSTPSTSSTPSPLTPSSVIDLSPKSSSPSSAKKFRSSMAMFDTSYPSLSIFNEIEPKDFAIKCHRLYLCYYFMSEMRIYQFYTRVDKRSPSGYVKEFYNFYSNLLRKLELEIDIFCDANKFSILVNIFITLSTYFIEVGNVPLAEMCLNLLDRFRICKPKKVKEFLESYNLELPLKVNALKDHKKFTYLVTPDSISKAFIFAHTQGDTPEKKIKSFSFIQNKIAATKAEILNNKIFLMKPSHEDFLLFNYINPKTQILEQLYKTPKPNSLEFLCIQEKCKE